MNGCIGECIIDGRRTADGSRGDACDLPVAFGALALGWTGDVEVDFFVVSRGGDMIELVNLRGG